MSSESTPDGAGGDMNETIETLTAERDALLAVVEYTLDYEAKLHAERDALRAEVERLRRTAAGLGPSCATCANRGRINGLSQETYCEGCIRQGQDFKSDYWRPLPPAPASKYGGE